MNTTDKIMALADAYASHARMAGLASPLKTREILRAEIEALVRDAERLRIERDHAMALYDGASRLIGGIYALMYPPKTKLADGRVMVFRPQKLDPHVVLQELSDRIRALPDELAAMQEKQS